MYPVSITRSPISWASLCAITVFVSACGGNSGSVSATPISDNPASEQVSVLPGNNEQTSEPNGTLSDGAPFEGEGNLPVAQEQAPDLSPALPVDANAEDLSEVAADLRRRFVDDARRSLLGLNNDYVSGMLEQSKFFCFDDSFPVTDYFCGGSDPAGWLTRYGSNLIGFTYNRTEVCAASVVAQGDSDDCSLEYAEFVYGDVWNAIYRVREVDFEFFDEVRISNIDANGDSDSCEITYGTASETFYSSDEACERILRTVATAISGS